MRQPADDLADPGVSPRVAQAMAEAGARAGVGLTAVVAGASGRYDRAEDIVGMWLGLGLAAWVWFAVPDAADAGPGSWAGVTEGVKFAAMAGAWAAGFVVGAVAASYLPALRRPFVPKRELFTCVERAADAALGREVLARSAPGGGGDAGVLLFYVSRYERRAVVLADAATIERLGSGGTEALCRELTGRLADGDTDAALIEATRRAEVLFKKKPC
ncbi:MAG: hypothetical protein AAF800_02535 [Planctomycetota bacterium]